MPCADISMRSARPTDASAAIEVVRQSITHLCLADHRNDEETLAIWLANKTPANFLEWLSNADIFCVVVEANQRLFGVGVLHRRGEILMFYVAPGAQRQGVGRRIYGALEAKATQWGATALQLESTALACAFYESLGYQSSGPPLPRFGVLQCFPYAKQLQPDQASSATVRMDGNT